MHALSSTNQRILGLRSGWTSEKPTLGAAEPKGQQLFTWTYKLILVTAGPKRRQLKVKDPLKFNWRPKELLPQLANIYLHLERADSKGAFASAIAASDRYRQDMFPETCQVSFQAAVPQSVLILCLEALSARHVVWKISQLLL